MKDDESAGEKKSIKPSKKLLNVNVAVVACYDTRCVSDVICA